MKRRNFLSITGTVTGGVLLLPNVLHSTALGLTSSPTGSRVVFLQLNGGNDGLNTVIPYSDPLYYRYRPKVAVPKSEVLRIDSELGWHPSLQGLSDIQQQGQLSMLQNVGYPNPVRSHFRSQEIWQTASGSGQYLDKGWLGRYLDLHCEDNQPTAGVNLDRVDNLALLGNSINSVTLPNPAGYRSRPGDISELGESDNVQLDFVRRIARSTTQGADAIQKALKEAPEGPSYPRTAIGKNLQWIARLIKGDLNTKVFYTSMNGYDTHDNQLVRHARLMEQLDSAVMSFYSDMRQSGLLESTTLVIFSEFGRRVKDNGSGTDHGTAAPMLIIGGRNSGQIWGTVPDLFDLDGGDLKHSIDFRSVYASILKDRLEMDPRSIGINNELIYGLFS